jgi:uncharacterized protein YndB with AHSA1/START domain
MIEVNNTLVINRPIDVVFAYATSIENLPEWVGPITDAKQTSEGPIGVGTTNIRSMNVMGRKTESPNKVTEYVLNSRFSTETTAGSLQTKERFIFESVDGGTRLTVEGQVEASGFLKLAAPVIASMARRQSATDFGTMKDILESQG